MASKTFDPAKPADPAALKERVDAPLTPSGKSSAAESDLILARAPGSEAELVPVPMGVIVDGQRSAAEKREYLIYTSFKNGGTLAALIWIAAMGTSWVEWTAFALFYVLNLLGHNMAHHRYFGHGAFKTSKPMRYALAILAQCGGYGSALYWVANHRRHHAHTDRPGDLHSPYYDGQGRPLESAKKGFAHSHIKWAFDNTETDMEVFGKGLLADPALVFAHKTRWVWFWTSGIIAPAIWGFAFGGTWQAALGTVLIAGAMRMMLALHAVGMINSVCHLWGSQRFEGHGKAKNNWFVALVSLGEGWHNNHHAHPRSASNSTRWWEVDMTFWFIRALEAVGLVWDVKRMPKAGTTQAKRVVRSR